MRLLTLKERITVFKTVFLALSEVIHLLLITKLHYHAIDFWYKIQRKFIWQRKKSKIKHSNLCNGYDKGGGGINMLT